MKDEQAQHKITLSIPRETWEAVNELAREHQRSFTKELVWALQAYVRRERRQRKGAAEG
jgi:predicted transcriptional regulator